MLHFKYNQQKVRTTREHGKVSQGQQRCYKSEMWIEGNCGVEGTCGGDFLATLVVFSDQEVMF